MATDSGTRIGNYKYSTDKLKEKLMHSATTSNYFLSINAPLPVLTYIERKKRIGIKGTNLRERINLSCIDASLPGSSFATHDVKSDFMGVSEKMAYRRMYDEQMSVSMIVDPEYKTLHFFEGWMDFIAGKEITDRGNNETYKNSINGFRMNYPDGDNGYRTKSVIELYKFEKDISTRQSIKYTMVEGFPISMNAMEISYGPTDLLRLTVNFSFVRYVTEPYSNIATTDDGLALNFVDSQGRLSNSSQNVA